jgi:hypothetical protein
MYPRFTIMLLFPWKRALGLHIRLIVYLSRRGGQLLCSSWQRTILPN